MAASVDLEKAYLALGAASADRVLNTHPTRDGDGVRIERIAGNAVHALLDPWLMLDELKSDAEADYIGGFPAHPHRGFETLTYMKVGAFRHRDSMGNEGVVGAGGLQWMSAASGVIHSEMPLPDGEKLHGFQLWLNLPAAEKMREPAYRDVQSEEVVQLQLHEGVRVRLPVGRFRVEDRELEGPLQLPESHAALLDLQLAPHAKLSLRMLAGHQYNLYVYEGDTANALQRGQLAHWAAQDADRVLSVQAGAEGLSALVFSGRPLRQPIVHYGPFVMNTMAEVEQALRDYRNGRLVKRRG